jgi:parvulin-like peptidyl-prolyl isomerase
MTNYNSKQKLHLSHILLKSKLEAEDVKRWLDSGKHFSELARKYSQCSSSKNGGDLGIVPLNKLDEEFQEAALMLKEGQVSQPIRTKFGYHIILRHTD